MNALSWMELLGFEASNNTAHKFCHRHRHPMWIKPCAVLRVSAGPLTLRLEKASGASPADPESYTIVRAHRGMSEVWRARGQCWRVRLEAPFRGEGFDALKELMQGTPKLSWAKRTSLTT